MERSLPVILDQCRKQAEKLIQIKVDDTFMKELDVFDTYFNQLKQVLNEQNAQEYKDHINKLQPLMERFKTKLENAKEATMKEIKNTETKKRSIGYGTQIASEAIKFDKRL